MKQSNTSFTCASTKLGRHKLNKKSKRLKPKWWQPYSDEAHKSPVTQAERARRRKKNKEARASRKANR